MDFSVVDGVQLVAALSSVGVLAPVGLAGQSTVDCVSEGGGLSGNFGVGVLFTRATLMIQLRGHQVCRTTWFYLCSN